MPMMNKNKNLFFLNGIRTFTAVSGIKKKQLAEVRSMANPPAIVKLALESICLMLNEMEDIETAPDWKTIRSILNKDSFIPSIMNYDTISITYANLILRIHKKKIIFFFSKIPFLY